MPVFGLYDRSPHYVHTGKVEFHNSLRDNLFPFIDELSEV